MLSLAAFSVTTPYLAKYTPLCGGCHATRLAYTSWRTSPHNDLSCFDCHRSPGIAGWAIRQLEAVRNLSAFVSGREARPSNGFSNDSCLSCHDILLSGTATNRSIRVSHKEIVLAKYFCVDCHAEAGHLLRGPRGASMRPTKDKCFTCHKSGARAKVSCPTCHTRVPTGKPVSKSAVGSLAHTGTWRKSHGVSDASSCLGCHKVSFCRKCHQTEVPHRAEWPTRHGKVAAKDGSDKCYKCHRASTCQSCHLLPMPHGPNYFDSHAAETKEAGISKCVICHLETDCVNCHSLHTRHSNVRRRAQEQGETAP